MRRKFRNACALRALKDLGFPLPRIRLSFHKLTGLTQSKIADALGVSRQTITHHMTGIGNNPSIKKRIAEMLEVPVHDFFGQDDIPKEAP